MFGPDDPDAVAVRPAVPAAGTPGWFQEGNPNLGTWPTLVRQWFLNMLVAELGALLAFVGIVENKANDGQVLEAVQRIAGPTGPRWNRSAAGTYFWMCPPGVFAITVRFTAGGGSGATGTAAPGGGGGGCISDVVPVRPGQAYPVVIAADGTIAAFGITVRPGVPAGAAPGAGGAVEGGSPDALRFPGGGGGYGFIVGGVAFSGTGGGCGFYGGGGSIVNNGGRASSVTVPGLPGGIGGGGTGGPNGPGGAGGAALAEVLW